MAAGERRLPATARNWLWAPVALAVVVLSPSGSQAHKGLVSPFDFNQHVLPIFSDRCGVCHFPGGPAPMSLLSYADAQPWAEAIREQLISEAMPPWYATPTGLPIRGSRTLLPRELDVLLTWISGGTPIGEPAKTRSATVPAREWLMGDPDLTIPMRGEHTVASGITEERASFLLATGLNETKWIGAVEFRPGTPAIVREATIQVQDGPVLATWVPGEDPGAGTGAAFKVAAGAAIRLNIRYKKNDKDIAHAVKDRSLIGLHFTTARPAGGETESHLISGSLVADRPLLVENFSSGLTDARRVLAIRPVLDRSMGSLEVAAVFPTGKHVILLFLQSPEPDWPRRYWFAEPIELPEGARILVTATERQATPGYSAQSGATASRITLELVTEPVNVR